MVQTCSSRTKTTLNILTQGIQLHLVLELLTDRLMTERPKSTTNSQGVKKHDSSRKNERYQSSETVKISLKGEKNSSPSPFRYNTNSQKFKLTARKCDSVTKKILLNIHI